MKNELNNLNAFHQLTHEQWSFIDAYRLKECRTDWEFSQVLGCSIEQARKTAGELQDLGLLFTVAEYGEIVRQYCLNMGFVKQYEQLRRNYETR